jgi:energy-coupling factor transporter ATP-binding protein EcfA2
LQFIFGDTELEFQFDRVQRNFFIQQGDKTKIDLNQLSDGYNQLIGIVSSIIMTTVDGLTINLDAQGIVLIDEIETHLHIDLQKKILPFLTSFFPKIQFIVTTHSPFVLNSVDNAVICDLEKRIVTTDLSGYSSEIIVESYFGTDKYSQILKDQVDEYEKLMSQETLSFEDEDRLDELESYFETIPKYLSDELTVKLQQIRLKNLKLQN